MLPVSTPLVCRRPHKLSTRYYRRGWPDLAPGLGNSLPIPEVMGINTEETCRAANPNNGGIRIGLRWRPTKSHLRLDLALAASRARTGARVLSLPE
jgi:hypothetical protein